MALTVQIIQDGVRNVIAKNTELVTGPDLAEQVLLDPALLSEMYPTRRASKLRITKIHYNIEDALAVYLSWETTETSVPIERLTGRGKFDFTSFGGLPSNAGVTGTGRILLATQGASAAELSYSIVVEAVKVE